MTASGRRSTTSPSATISPRRAWRAAPASTRPRSTRRSASRPTAASAGRRPRACRRSSRRRGCRSPSSWACSSGKARRGRAPEPSFRQVPLLGLAQAGAGGFFDDGGFPAGQGWDEVDIPGAARRRRLCAQGHRRFDAAALPRRRHHHRLPGRAVPARRPGGGEDPRGRGDGEGAPEARRRRRSNLPRSTPTIRTARCPMAEIEWIARIIWASQ